MRAKALPINAGWNPIVFPGYPKENAETIRARSPISFAHRAKTPTLILHPEADLRVPIEQGVQLYTALKKAGVTVELVRYPREGHDLREPNHIRDRDRRMIEWLERFLNPKTAASSGSKAESSGPTTASSAP